MRLTETAGPLAARRATSNASRIDAKAFNGNTGDPWAPVNADGKSLTLGEGGAFHYKRLCDLLFSGEWRKPLLACPGESETGDMLLVAEAFARGNSKTGGFKSRVLPAPAHVLPLFQSETTATLARAQIEEIGQFTKALRFALALVAAGGATERDAVGKKHYTHAASAGRRFGHAADRLFFPSLWRRVVAVSKGDDAEADAKRTFLADLKAAAWTELDAALPAIPCPAVLRPRAEARARRAFRGRIRRTYPELRDQDGVVDAP